MNAAIYARTATTQASHSIDDQIAACRTIAEREGYHVTRIFSDAGQSGMDAERAGLADLMREAGAFDAVIVTDLDRLSRNAADLAAISERLRKILKR